MDRKLFFSYIQNMQQNNPDMIGFQNSMRKNSWQKPMSLIEQTNSLRDDFENHISELVHGTEGEPGLYHSYMQSLPKGIVPTQITGFHHDPDSTHSGPGFKKIESGVSLALDAHDALSSLGDRAKGQLYRDLSDLDQERVRDMFVDEMSQRHQAEMMEPDQDEIDMTTDALEKQGRYESYNRLGEAVLRTGAPESYIGGKDNVTRRQMSRRFEAGAVLTALMDPTHPINNDPAHADERESLIRALTDMEYFPNKRGAGEINYGRVSGGRDMEFLGAPANDPTRTGPGTASANVQDLRRYAKFAGKRIYDRVYTGPTPPGFMKPTDEMTHVDPHNLLREAIIQMNEVKANVRGEYPRTVYSADQDPTDSPSGASGDKRSLVRYAAEAALNDNGHWIHDPKHHNIRRALFNFTNENTQTEDLPHIVTFMNQDPKFKRDLEQLNADIEKYGHF